MKKFTLSIIGLMAMGLMFSERVQGKEQIDPKVYVPYRDLAAAVNPGTKAILMERSAFEKLLADAQARGRTDDRDLCFIDHAEYSARVSGAKLELSGTLTVRSLTPLPITVPVEFARVGLTGMELDGKPAPVGLDEQGKPVVLVEGKGDHRLTAAGSASLKEQAGGGMQVDLTLPAATSGTMKLTAIGDMTLAANVPSSTPIYDKKQDRTTTELTLGGFSSLVIALIGNGRQEDQRAILLGNSTQTFQLTASDQVMRCEYTVQVLRRGVRELRFSLGREWTVTQVSCPDLARWRVEKTGASDRQTVVMQLRAARQGSVIFHVEAGAPRKDKTTWQSPTFDLTGADFQHGYLLVSGERELRVRGETLTDTRREDMATAAAVGLAATTAGRLYYHWGDRWLVAVDLAEVVGRTASSERQTLAIAKDQLSLEGRFDLTAIGEEIFDASFILPGDNSGWVLDGVTVNDRADGFEYHTDALEDRRRLKIDFARPAPSDGLVSVRITLRHIPKDWDWMSSDRARAVRIPLIAAESGGVTGLFCVQPKDDLDAASITVPEEIKPVPVGRMSALGLPGGVTAAYRYTAAAGGPIVVAVVRRAPRVSAQAVGMVGLEPTNQTGDWRITYSVSRAHVKQLYLLADRRIGQQIRIEPEKYLLASRHILRAGIVQAPPGYDVWQLTLDQEVLGPVVVNVHYDRPRETDHFTVPLIRPAKADPVAEVMAIQASEELAVAIEPKGTSELDAIDLPPLPVTARRLLAAYRLAGAESQIKLTTVVHQDYAVPAALAESAEFLTYLGPRSEQRTQADFKVINAGMQFLTVTLPPQAQLWSARVGRHQVKPQRDHEGHYLIALPRTRTGVMVRIVYAWTGPTPTASDQIQLGPADLIGIPVNRQSWQVWTPPGYQIASPRTTMTTSDLAATSPAYVGVVYAFGSVFEALKGFPGCCLLPSLSRARESAKRSSEASSLSQLYKAMHLYSQDNNGYFPDTLDRLVEKDFAQKDILLDMNRYRFEFFRPKEKIDDVSPQRIIAWSSAHDGGRNVLYGDGHVAWTHEKGLASPEILVAQNRVEAQEEDFYAGQVIKGIPERQQAQKLPSSDFAQAFLAPGRLTLPVDLVPPPSGTSIRFTGIGLARLTVGLVEDTRLAAWWYFGLVLVAAIGASMLMAPARRKVVFVVVVLALSSLLATWWPGLAFFANGAFYGALALVVFYVLVRIVRGIQFTVPIKAVPTTAVLLIMLMVHSVRAASPEIIIPYDGDPTEAQRSTKVLVPYARYVELWNQAHPRQPIDLPASAARAAVADVRYAVTISGDKLELVLTALVKTFGQGWVTLPIPFTEIAVTEATLDGQPASLQTGPQGMVLTLRGGSSGALRIRGLTTPKQTGRRGGADLTLPPLPAGVMTVRPPQPDLELQATGPEGVLERQPDGQWAVPLGRARMVSLRWSPKANASGTDRTLSAEVSHDVDIFHWGIAGSTKITFKFAAGDYDRFALLVPEGLRLTNVAGSNLRDYQTIGKRRLEGRSFDLLDVRLHRPVTRGFELTMQWLSDLPELNKPTWLSLPRTADAARESGTLTLSAAAGVTVKTDQVIGGRRSTINPEPAAATTETTRKTAQYVWPYQPFAISLILNREKIDPTAAIDQLIRVTPQAVQLLVRANVRARNGKLFGAGFSLPDGYDVLNVTGPLVESHYVQPGPDGRRLEVNFRRAVDHCDLAVMMVREGDPPDPLSIPTIIMIDGSGKTIARQTGRLAVQVAPALDAQTAADENLKPIATRTMRDWLDPDQAQAAQFGYEYETPRISLTLNVHPRPTRVRADVLVGLAIQPTAAVYAYRVRYAIEGSPVDHVRFTLLSAYASLVAVDCPALRNVATRETGDHQTQWTIALANEVTGAVDVTVNLTLPIDNATKTLEIPRLIPDAPAGVQTIAAVQNFSRHQITLGPTVAMSPLAVSDQRKLLPEKLGSSLQYVQQSFSPDWTLVLNVKPDRGATRVQVVVDLMEITTVIGRGGDVRYRVKLSLQNRSEQFLKVRVPGSLALWSAEVAGQAVKPVTASTAAPGTVLIPLVKTSAGGLPYDVVLYLAGGGITPLDGLTRLAFPAVKILDVPVIRTTWSLRLPGGFHYTRPGGDMSPVAGTAEVMSISTDALIEQIRRLEKYQSETASLSRRTYADENLRAANQALKSNLEKSEQYIESNRVQLEGSDYDRLKQQIGKQRQYQQTLEHNVAQSRAPSAEADGKDITQYLNRFADQAGWSETRRNQTLNTIPSFVGRAGLPEQRQPSRGREIKKEVGSVSGGRMEQFFTKQSAGTTVTRQGRRGKGPILEKEKLEDFAQKYPNMVDGPGMMGPGGVPGKPATGPMGSSFGLLNAPVQAAYPSRGTFSLPITLPEGEVQLDFTKPSGDVTLSLWAVPMDLVHRIQRTGTVLAGLLLALLLAKLARYLPAPQVRVPGKYWALYAGGFILLALMGGLLGMIMAVIAIFAIEINRRLKEARETGG